MANNIFDSITRFINRVVSVVSTGSLERVRIIREFNLVFQEAFLQGSLAWKCVVTTSAGKPEYKHELSTFYLRSGFKITIENDKNLQENDYIEIAGYVIQNLAFVRQLMALGYDTLIVVGRNNHYGAFIPLKTIANLHNYMLNEGL